MSVPTPAAFYEAQLTKYSALLDVATKRIRQISRLRLLVALIALGSIVAAINNNIAWQWWLSAGGTALFLMLVRIHGRAHEQQKLLQIHVHIVKEEQGALSGNITPFEAGAAYIDSNHPYSYDLDIFGKGSVYQLLNRTITYNARDGPCRTSERCTGR